MKQPFFVFIVLITCICSCTGNSDETALRRRFEGYLKAIDDRNADSVQAYAYPKLLTLLSPGQARKTMEKWYDLFKGKVDSIRIDTIFPVFHIDKGIFAKAFYLMTITTPADSTEADTEKISFEPVTKKNLPDPAPLKHSIGLKSYPAPQITLLATLIRGDGAELIDYQVKNKMRIMKLRLMAIAAKDEFAKEWSFFTVTNDDELINKLFPRQVLEKMASKD